MGNMHLVTGYAGKEHITAVDQAAFNAALIGTGQFVLDKGKVFEAQVISNNQIRVFDGELMVQGRFVRLDSGTYVDLSIDNGAQGMKRNDLVVARYTKHNTTGVEDVDLVVIKGTAAASKPSDPAHTEGDITNGAAAQHDFPLWRIPIDGLNVGEPVALFEPFSDSLRTLPGIRQQVLDIHAEVDAQLAKQDAEMDSKIAGIESYLKSETLTNETKMKFGLDTDAVPDDVLDYLSSYSQHWWKRKSLTSVTKYRENRKQFSEVYGDSYITFCHDGTATMYVSDSVAFDEDTGKYALVNPEVFVSARTAMMGRYVQSSDGAILVGNMDSTTKVTDILHLKILHTNSSQQYRASYLAYDVPVLRAEPYEVDTGEITYVHSLSRNAYQDSGDDGEFKYEYLGVPFDNAVAAPKIATGSYVGTGTYGKDNPTSLTFDFEPSLVVVHMSGYGLIPDGRNWVSSMLWTYGQTTASINGGSGGTGVIVEHSGNTLSWYNTSNALNQLNGGQQSSSGFSAYTYYYVAIG